MKTNMKVTLALLALGASALAARKRWTKMAMAS
jgi:hypothetical protein